MKAKPIFLIPFLLFIVSCTRVENKIVTYIAEVPFSTEYYRDFEFDILNDSAFIIKTLYLTPGSLSDESTHLRVSSGKIYKIDNYFYAKDDLSGEIILFSKKGNQLLLFNSRYATLDFKMDESDFNEQGYSSKEDLYCNYKKYFTEAYEKLNLYKDQAKDLNSSYFNDMEFSIDSIIEFSNYFGLSLVLSKDSTYFYTIENLLFSTGVWQFENGNLIFTESITFRNRPFPFELSDKMQDFIENNDNIYRARMVDDSTLFMGTLPFAQSCKKMKRVQPSISCKFFKGLLVDPI